MPTIRKRGEKWQAQVRIKQSGVLVFSESASFNTEREARRWAGALEAKVLRDGAEAHYTQSATIQMLSKAWLRHKEGLKPLRRGMSHSFTAIQKAPFVTRPLPSITSKDYMDWG